MKIGIDAFGGDNAPEAVILGVKEALNSIESNIVLYGDEATIVRLLTKHEVNLQKIEIVHTTQIVSGDDKPVMAVKKKKDSSMIKGLMDLRKKEVDAFLSAGNTGALLAGGLLKVGRIKGVDRPALVSVYPTNIGISVLADAGANAECKARNLKEFSIMGSLYAKEILQIENPKVGLVNIGDEKGKGTALVKEAYEEIEKLDNINFIGNVEARDIPFGQADVIVCDGFTGNVILKLSEGVAKSLSDMFKSAFMKNVFTKISALAVKSGLSDIKKKLDYSEYGGAPLLGVKELIVKAHGSSSPKAFKNAIIYAEKALKNDLIRKIEKNL
ncbi:phosphate acyltransferase PlsX [Clostridiaceae bacterium HSG29]|nr:phosphate acyltransferase PlsX [Clostridiaceae bacterium HSG29]